MEPEEVSPTTIFTLEPKFFKKRNFFLIPLRMENDDQPIFLRFTCRKFKFFPHNHGKSVGIELFHTDDTDEEKTKLTNSLQFLKKRIQKLE